jgi:septal ring factor EnvC (AmiA/AmiB activator)
MNLRIKHHGLGFPIGEIVPDTAFADPERLIELGAVEAIEAPATMEPPIADVMRLDDDELVAENERLQKLVGNMPTELAETKKALAESQRDVLQLRSELEKTQNDLKASEQITEALESQLAKVIEAHKQANN